MTYDMTPIGFLGAGPFAVRLAAKVVAAGRPVVMSNSRGPQTLGDVTSSLGPLASAATFAEVAAMPIVVLAVPWLVAPDLLKTLPRWDNRILIDVTNHYRTYSPPTWVDIGDRVGTEMIAAEAPGARFVRAFNTLRTEQLDMLPTEGEGKRVIFISGDDTEANAIVRDLAIQINFAPIARMDLTQPLDEGRWSAPTACASLIARHPRPSRRAGQASGKPGCFRSCAES
jgi:8-hydroxy-5-deazaflavin:NADPH oxidoreductase